MLITHALRTRMDEGLTRINFPFPFIGAHSYIRVDALLVCHCCSCICFTQSGRIRSSEKARTYFKLSCPRVHVIRCSRQYVTSILFPRRISSAGRLRASGFGYRHVLRYTFDRLRGLNVREIMYTINRMKNQLTTSFILPFPAAGLLVQCVRFCSSPILVCTYYSVHRLSLLRLFSHFVNSAACT
jgi:hypothetical protein